MRLLRLNEKRHKCAGFNLPIKLRAAARRHLKHAKIKENTVIYLASPYTHSDSEVREKRYDLAVSAMAAFLKDKQNVYSPIVHCHVITVRHALPFDHQFWVEYNNHFLGLCEKIYVLCIDGWEESVGVQKEIDFAYWHCIPIEFFEFNTENKLFPVLKKSF